MKPKKRFAKPSAKRNAGSGVSRMRLDAAIHTLMQNSQKYGWVMFGETNDGSLLAFVVSSAVVIDRSRGSSGRCVWHWESGKRKASWSRLSETLNAKAHRAIPRSDALAVARSLLSRKLLQFTLLAPPDDEAHT